MNCEDAKDTTSILTFQLMEVLQRDVFRINDRAFSVYLFEELEAQAARLGYPCVAITYLGLFASGQSNPKARQSELADAYFDLLVIGQPEETAGDGERWLTVTELLATMRKELVGLQNLQFRREWRFVNEKPTDIGGRIAYVQRWAIRVPIV